LAFPGLRAFDNLDASFLRFDAAVSQAIAVFIIGAWPRVASLLDEGEQHGLKDFWPS
jgi:hypothetical protein